MECKYADAYGQVCSACEDRRAGESCPYLMPSDIARMLLAQGEIIW